MSGLLKNIKKKTKEIMAGPDNSPPTHTLTVTIAECRNLSKKDMTTQTDAYVAVNVSQQGRSGLWGSVHRATKIMYNTRDPSFNETYMLPVRRQMIESLHVRVYDKDSLGIMDKVVGECYIPLADLMTGAGPLDRWYDLQPPRGGQVRLAMALTAGWNDAAAKSAPSSIAAAVAPSTQPAAYGGYGAPGSTTSSEGGYQTSSPSPYEGAQSYSGYTPAQSGGYDSGYTAQPAYAQPAQPYLYPSAEAAKPGAATTYGNPYSQAT